MEVLKALVIAIVALWGPSYLAYTDSRCTYFLPDGNMIDFRRFQWNEHAVVFEDQLWAFNLCKRFKCGSLDSYFCQYRKNSILSNGGTSEPTIIDKGVGSYVELGFRERGGRETTFQLHCITEGPYKGSRISINYNVTNTRKFKFNVYSKRACRVRKNRKCQFSLKNKQVLNLDSLPMPLIFYNSNSNYWKIDFCTKIYCNGEMTNLCRYLNGAEFTDGRKYIQTFIEQNGTKYFRFFNFNSPQCPRKRSITEIIMHCLEHNTEVFAIVPSTTTNDLCQTKFTLYSKHACPIKRYSQCKFYLEDGEMIDLGSVRWTNYNVVFQNQFWKFNLCRKFKCATVDSYFCLYADANLTAHTKGGISYPTIADKGAGSYVELGFRENSGCVTTFQLHCITEGRNNKPRNLLMNSAARTCQHKFNMYTQQACRVRSDRLCRIHINNGTYFDFETTGWKSMRTVYHVYEWKINLCTKFLCNHKMSYLCRYHNNEEFNDNGNFEPQEINNNGVITKRFRMYNVPNCPNSERFTAIVIRCIPYIADFLLVTRFTFDLCQVELTLSSKNACAVQGG